MSIGGSSAGEANARRLTPTMVAMRLLVLDFVHDYIGRWRHSPSLGEIGAALHVSPKHASKAIASLVDSGLLLKAPGPRGLALPDQRDTAIRLLSGMGFQVTRAQQVVTKSALLAPEAIDYTSLRSGRGRYGRQGRKEAGTGEEQGGRAASAG